MNKINEMMTLGRSLKTLENKVVFFVGDLHYTSNSYQECHDILEEICEHKRNRYPDTESVIVFLGDVCDRNKLNAIEIFQLTSLMSKVRETFEHRIIIEGNHDQLDKDFAVTTYLKYAGFQIWKDDVLWNNNILLGHYFIDKSNSSFGSYRHTLAELKKEKFKYCLLGHQHDYQKIYSDNNKIIIHLGSSRWVHFNEVSDKKYFACLFHDNLSLIEINKATKMYSNVDNLEFYRNIPDNSKVRYVFKSYDQVKKEISTVMKESKRFSLFKRIFKFDNEAKKIENDKATKTNKDIKSIINKWISNIDDDKVKDILSEVVQQEISS